MKAWFSLALFRKKILSFPVSIAAAHNAVLVATCWCFGNEMSHFVQSLSIIMSTQSSPFQFAVTDVAYQLSNKFVPVM